MTQTRDPSTGQLFDDGAAHVNTIGHPGILEGELLVINGAGDLFTDPTAPVVGELFKVSSSSGLKRARVTYHCQNPGDPLSDEVPVAASIVATINAGDDAVAITRLTVTDNGVGDYTANTALPRMASPAQPVLEWNLRDATVTDIYIGGIPPIGTGALPVYVTVEIW